MLIEDEWVMCTLGGLCYSFVYGNSGAGAKTSAKISRPVNRQCGRLMHLTAGFCFEIAPAPQYRLSVRRKVKEVNDELG